MRSWTSIFLALVFQNAGQAAAVYSPLAFYQLAAGSDLVVLGRIVSVSDSTFSLAVEDVLVGAAPEAELQIRRFKDWTCSQRWLPYAIGQREIAFLCRRESGYRTNSGGSEGEWQIIGSEINCDYMSSEYSHPEVEILERALPLALVVSAIRDFGACVRIDADWRSRKEGGPSYKETIVELCDAPAIDALAERSEVHRYLIDSLRAAQSKRFGAPISCGLR